MVMDMDSTPPAPSPGISLTPPLPLHEKKLLFADWELSDSDNSQSLPRSGTTVEKKTDSRLAQKEIEHRRKSRAFAAAAKRAAEQAIEKTRAEEAARIKALREEEGECDNDDIVEAIDLTQTPRPRPPPHPRRTVSTIIESVRETATLRRTSSNPLPEGQGRETKRKREREDVAANTTAKRKPGRPPKATKKDKKDARDITPPLVSERQRIFDGLSFCYLPETALGARKLRINKARQHGARWVQELTEATHVIVDKQLKWAEVEMYVKDKLAKLSTEEPESTPKWPILVNETYPLDCIGFRHLLNPGQLRYRITGWAQARAAKEKEKEKAKEKDAVKEKTKENGERQTTNTSPPNRYLIKPGRRQQSRLGTTGQQEHMIRQPRQGR
ncbi:hypothetical protein Sste5346_007969 [Sporothrix stenoceras]|uniref:BRCT domain-containing protein n=1 Tax=Sporothrix stenoceras TaxID=5173 RepID=A0ABR3YSC1_9PEZI